MIAYFTLVNDAYDHLKKLDESKVSLKLNSNKWSKKEILGHLCDSCINNYYRFMHLQQSSEPYVIEKYDQEMWVAVRGYQNQSWEETLQLWYALNLSLLNVLDQSLDQHSDKPVIIDGEKYTYQYLAEDYFDHLQHHLNQIFS
ncbi:DinB family protein [Marinoscillum sp.]|uniref:DinB family protein n=1 Tax=Marinoscillum sp. TaxID=2024838 RepID=UPI003BAD67E3